MGLVFQGEAFFYTKEDIGMNNFDFYSPTEFVFGKRTEERTGELAARYGAHHVLLVYGSERIIHSGLAQRIEYSLHQAGIDYTLFGGIQSNPIDTKVYEGIKVGQENHIDMLLAVGGGSVIDSAKAIAAGIAYDGDFWDFYAGITVMQAALPVGVVLTIPAAGSEGSGNSVITQVSSKKKISLRTPRALRPKFAIMNPELTMTLPAYQTAAGAVDMMAHIQERYFTNTPHTEVTDTLSEALLRTIIDTVPKVLAQPNDYDARAALMWCGTLAHNGLCGTGNEEDWASHAIEHELSAFYGVTHGAGLAVVFPAWLTFMADHNVNKVAQYAHQVWKVTPTADKRTDALEGIARMKKFFHNIGMPTNIAELGIDDFDLELINNHLHITKGDLVGKFVPLNEEYSRQIYQYAVRG